MSQWVPLVFLHYYKIVNVIYASNVTIKASVCCGHRFFLAIRIPVRWFELGTHRHSITSKSHFTVVTCFKFAEKYFRIAQNSFYIQFLVAKYFFAKCFSRIRAKI